MRNRSAIHFMSWSRWFIRLLNLSTSYGTCRSPMGNQDHEDGGPQVAKQRGYLFCSAMQCHHDVDHAWCQSPKNGIHVGPWMVNTN